MRTSAVVAVACGLVISAAVLIGHLLYGPDPFLGVLAIVVFVGMAVAVGVRRPWGYAVATAVLLIAAFVMFQFSVGGPAGDEITELAETYSGGVSWSLFVIAVVGVVAGIATIRVGNGRDGVGGTAARMGKAPRG